MQRIGVLQRSIQGLIQFRKTSTWGQLDHRNIWIQHLRMYAVYSQLYIDFKVMIQDINDGEKLEIGCCQTESKTKQVLTLLSRTSIIYGYQSVESLDLSILEIQLSRSLCQSKVLGVKIDTNLTFGDHVQAVGQECNRHLCNHRVIAS